jgi:hypothetical protein
MPCPPQRHLQKVLHSNHVSSKRQHEIDSVAGPIDGPVEVPPASAHTHIGCIDQDRLGVRSSPECAIGVPAHIAVPSARSWNDRRLSPAPSSALPNRAISGSSEDIIGRKDNPVVEVSSSEQRRSGLRHGLYHSKLPRWHLRQNLPKWSRAIQRDTGAYTYTRLQPLIFHRVRSTYWLQSASSCKGYTTRLDAYSFVITTVSS